MHSIAVPEPYIVWRIHPAIEACDGLDGLEDGVITVPGQCDFDPSTKVGQSYYCSLTKVNTTITEAAAIIAEWTWKGATSSRNEPLWSGLNVDASFLADTATTCSANGICTGSPLGFFDIWVRYFLTMDPDFDMSTVNVSVFSKLFHQSVNRYDSIIGTSDPDLSYFKEAGGKLISWHGLADSLIAPNTTLDYAQRVYERDPEAGNYYRFFEAPGVEHCGGGSGWFPSNELQSLIDWVEKGVAPTRLEAQTQNAAVKRSVDLCLWPKSLHFVSGDANQVDSFECR
ncbi:hypothetical protein E8E11_009702 [Didymella keratinophila]|nr:hypothetical protein E8E11_009702 [Didymella keratinophila]